jgi:hypothetical protein
MNINDLNVAAKRKRTQKNNVIFKLLFVLSIFLFLPSVVLTIASILIHIYEDRNFIMPFQLWIVIAVLLFISVNFFRNALDIIECINLNYNVSNECAYLDKKYNIFVFTSEENVMEFIRIEDIVGMPKYGLFNRCYIKYKALDSKKPKKTLKMSIGYIDPEYKETLELVINALRTGEIEPNSKQKQVKQQTAENQKPVQKELSNGNNSKNIESSSNVSDDDISQISKDISTLSSLNDLLIAQGKVLDLITKYNNELEKSIEDYKMYKTMETDDENSRALMLSGIKQEIDVYKIALDGFFKMNARIEELIKEKMNN